MFFHFKQNKLTWKATRCLKKIKKERNEEQKNEWKEILKRFGEVEKCQFWENLGMAHLGIIINFYTN